MPDTSSLRGLCILAVEDESLVAMQLEDILSDLGCEIAGSAMRVEHALAMLNDGRRIDAAVLDMNVAGVKVYPVAGRLRELHVPFIFATGYGVNGIEPEWRDHPILQKPYTTDQIEQALQEALRARKT